MYYNKSHPLPWNGEKRYKIGLFSYVLCINVRYILRAHSLVHAWTLIANRFPTSDRKSTKDRKGRKNNKQ